MGAIYKIDITKFGSKTLLNLPDSFSSMDKDSMENFKTDFRQKKDLCSNKVPSNQNKSKQISP